MTNERPTDLLLKYKTRGEQLEAAKDQSTPDENLVALLEGGADERVRSMAKATYALKNRGAGI